MLKKNQAQNNLQKKKNKLLKNQNLTRYRNKQPMINNVYLLNNREDNSKSFWTRKKKQKRKANSQVLRVILNK